MRRTTDYQSTTVFEAPTQLKAGFTHTFDPGCQHLEHLSAMFILVFLTLFYDIILWYASHLFDFIYLISLLGWNIQYDWASLQEPFLNLGHK